MTMIRHDEYRVDENGFPHPWIYYDIPLFYLTRRNDDNSPAIWCNDYDSDASVCIPITEEELASFLEDNSRLKEICYVGRPCYINLDDRCVDYIRTTLTNSTLELVPYL